ncbi:hypothetical protein EYF80_030182 [Liparis tanakae]|uniref:Uncharacterized protein n=1 Tax=Liparis tanakae TaxID=230148 RepID=A0A4Z2H2C4_9TELE|nr:hypothetical protein EYF80_030182 [Liparis tanakae]
MVTSLFSPLKELHRNRWIGSKSTNPFDYKKMLKCEATRSNSSRDNSLGWKRKKHVASNCLATSGVTALGGNCAF